MAKSREEIQAALQEKLDEGRSQLDALRNKMTEAGGDVCPNSETAGGVPQQTAFPVSAWMAQL